MIDDQGYRANVGIILTNDEGKLFWGKRIGMDAWQFPQGGIKADETVVAAMYRELQEETGLKPDHVELLGVSDRWLRYRLPKRYIRKNNRPVCIGQKQRWCLLRLLVDEDNVRLDTSVEPEFEYWQWIDFWKPSREVVSFKRHVYRRALAEFKPLVFSN